MSERKIDAVFVGGGHNGLVAATRLAQSGLRVAVVEAAEHPGGGAGEYEIHAGFRAPALAHVLPAFDRRAARALGANGAGLGAGAGSMTTMALLPDGAHLELGPDPSRTAAALRAHSSADAAAWPDLHGRLHAHATTLRPLLEATPPRLDVTQRGNLLALGRLGWSIRRRGRGRMRELLRILTMNVADLLEDELESDALRGALALDAVLGTDHGPRSPNTVFTLLHRLAGQPSGRNGSSHTPAGGVGRTGAVLAEAATAAGVNIRTGTAVRRILAETGAVRGVELDDGGTIEAGLVVSNADPVTTFAELVGPDHLDADFLAEVRAIRTRGTTGKVTFALERQPALPLPAEGGATRWVVAPSIDYVEQAFDHVKYGEPVPEPALEITLPSLTDPGCAPAGQHVMSVNVAYAPYGGDASTLGETVTALIERHAPGFADSVIAREAWGPREIEQRFGMRGGHWHHGDIALDQFFLTRPVPGFQQYRTPLDGLYLCGAGAHPGGGVTGTNGINAAREILRDRRHGRKAA